MSSAFAWLNNMIQSLGQLIPRLVLIRKTYRGILFRYNGSTAMMEPGLTWYWPISSELRLIPTTTRVWELESVTVTGNPVRWGDLEIPTAAFIGGTVQATVTDPTKLIKVYGLRSTAVGLARMAMRELWEDGAEGFAARVIQRLEGEYADFGLRLERFAVTDSYTCVMFSGKVKNLDGDWCAGDSDVSDGG